MALTVRSLRNDEVRLYLEIHERAIRGLAGSHYSREDIEGWVVPLTTEVRAARWRYSDPPSAIITSVGRRKRMNAPDSTRPPTMLTTNGTTKIRSSLRS